MNKKNRFLLKLRIIPLYYIIYILIRKLDLKRFIIRLIASSRIIELESNYRFESDRALKNSTRVSSRIEFETKIENRVRLKSRNREIESESST